MPINVGGIEVEIKLNNGQLVSGLIKNEELVKLTGQKIEGHMGRTANKVQNAFSRMFGIGALIGTGLMLVRSFYGAIQNGIAKAVASNDELSGRMSRLKNSLNQMFIGLGIALLPIIDKVTKMLEQLAKYTNQGYERKIASNNEEIKKFESIIASAQTRSGGVFGFLEKKTITDAQRNIDRLKKENQAIEKQVGLLNKVATAQNKVYEKGETNRVYYSTDELKNATNAVLDGVNKLIPAGSEAGNKVNQLGQAVIQIAENAKKIDLSNLTAGNIVSIFSTLVNLADSLANALTNIFDASSTQAQKSHIAELTNYVEKYKNALEKLNQDIAWFKKEVENQQITYDTSTKEGIDKMIASKKTLIGTNDTLIAQDKKLVEDAEKTYGTDLTGARKSIKDKMADFNRIRLELASHSGDSIEKGMEYIAFMKNYDVWMADWQAQIDALDLAIAAKTELGTLEGENLTYASDIADLEQQRADLIAEQAKAEWEIVEAMKEQTREMLSQQAQLGLLDVENYGDALLALSQLQTAGYSGLDLLSAMSDIGFNNELSQSTSVGQIVVNNYMASNNSANIQSMLSNQFGA